VNATPPTPRYNAPDPRPRPASDFGFGPPPAPRSGSVFQPQRQTDGSAADAPAASSLTVRDRLAVHLAWEVVLAFLLVVLVVIFLISNGGTQIGIVISQAGVFGLMATGMAFSLRTGAPNLAVGAIAVFTGGLGGYMIAQGGWNRLLALTVVVVLATLFGVVMGAVAAALSVPAWAITLAGAVAIEMLTQLITDGRVMPVQFLDNYSTLWFLLFLLVSVGGGILWQRDEVRRRLGAARDATDPAKRAGGTAALGMLIGITGSSFLSALGGVALLMRLSGSPGPSGLHMTMVALAAALFGGVSMYGRRAGVAGTTLALLFVTGITTLVAFSGAEQQVTHLIVALFVVLGAGVTRVLEAMSANTSVFLPGYRR